MLRSSYWFLATLLLCTAGAVGGGCSDGNCQLGLTALDLSNGHAPFGVQLDFQAVTCDGTSPPELADEGTFWVNGPDGQPVAGATVDVSAYSFDATYHYSMGLCVPDGSPEGVYTLNILYGDGGGSLPFNVNGRFDGTLCNATAVATCGVACDLPDCGGTVGCCERVGCSGGACGDDGCGEPCGECDDGESCGPNRKCSAPWSVAAGEQDPRGVATDAYFIYWTLDSGSAVKRANKDGSDVVTLGATPGWAVRVDARNVFWTSHTDGRILRAAKDGTDVDPDGAPLPVELAGGQADPRGLALDDDYVYWTDIGDDAVRRVSKDGGDVEDIATKQQAPRNVFIEGDFVYWTNSASGTVLEDGTVNRAPRNGGPRQILASEQVSPWGLYVDETYVYWTSYVDAGRVYRTPKAGGSPPELVAEGFANPRDIVGDTTSIFWNAVGPQNSNGEYSAGQVFQLRKDFTLGRILAKDQKWLGLLNVDSSSVFWAQGGTLGNQTFFLDGRVMGGWKE